MKHFLPVIAALLLAPFSAMDAADAPVARVVKVSYSEDDFRQGKAHRAQTVEIAAKGKLVVSLGSNITTGYSWSEHPEMKGDVILKQARHRAIGSGKDLEGAGGTEEWTFEAVATGRTTLRFSYSRPWAGGEKDVWTLNLTVVVK